MPVVRAFYLAAKRFVSLAQLLELSSVPFRVRDLLTVTERQQSADTQVDANLFLNWRQWLNINVYQQRDRPPTSGRQLYGNGGWLSTFRQQPTPTNRQWLSTFSQVDLTVLVLKRRFRIED